MANAANYIKVNPEDAQKYNIGVDKSSLSKDSGARKVRSPTVKSTKNDDEKTEDPRKTFENKQPKFFRKTLDHTSPRGIKSPLNTISDITMEKEDEEKKKLLRIIK